MKVATLLQTKPSKIYPHGRTGRRSSSSSLETWFPGTTSTIPPPTPVAQLWHHPSLFSTEVSLKFLKHSQNDKIQIVSQKSITLYKFLTLVAAV
jgi:hypothetical protein